MSGTVDRMLGSGSLVIAENPGKGKKPKKKKKWGSPAQKKALKKMQAAAKRARNKNKRKASPKKKKAAAASKKKTGARAKGGGGGSFLIIANPAKKLFPSIVNIFYMLTWIFALSVGSGFVLERKFIERALKDPKMQKYARLYGLGAMKGVLGYIALMISGTLSKGELRRFATFTGYGSIAACLADTVD